MKAVPTLFPLSSRGTRKDWAIDLHPSPESHTLQLGIPGLCLGEREYLELPR